MKFNVKDITDCIASYYPLSAAYLCYNYNFKNFISRYKLVSPFHASQQIKVYSTNTSESNEIKYDKKIILEIIKSIIGTSNFKIAFTHKSVRLFNIDNKSY